MAGYVELTEGYEFEETIAGQTGTRVFVPKTGGGATLPIIGQGFPGHPACIASGVNEKMFGQTPTIKVYTVSYSSIEQEDPPDPDDYPRSIDVGVEMLNIGKSGRQWTGATGVEQDMYKRIVTATVGITKTFGNFNDLMSRFKKCAGKVNSDEPFLGQDAKQFLFSGAHSEETRNSLGAKIWKTDFQFEFRAPDKDGDGDFGTWETIWRESTGAWEDLDVATPLYDSIDFGTELLD